MKFIGEIVFSIMDKNEIVIDKKMDLCATRIINTGEEVSIGKRTQKNVWIHEIKFSGEDDFQLKLKEFAKILYARKNSIGELVLKYEFVSIDIYIRSELGQLGFTIYPETLKQIGELQCDMNIHILSYGQAEEYNT